MKLRKKDDWVYPNTYNASQSRDIQEKTGNLYNNDGYGNRKIKSDLFEKYLSIKEVRKILGMHQNFYNFFDSDEDVKFYHNPEGPKGLNLRLKIGQRNLDLHASMMNPTDFGLDHFRGNSIQFWSQKWMKMIETNPNFFGFLWFDIYQKRLIFASEETITRNLLLDMVPFKNRWKLRANPSNKMNGFGIPTKECILMGSDLHPNIVPKFQVPENNDDIFSDQKYKKYSLVDFFTK